MPAEYLSNAYKMGGTAALSERAGQVGKALVNRGANFAKQNPGAAAAIGGGALGTAALGGAMAGRASA